MSMNLPPDQQLRGLQLGNSSIHLYHIRGADGALADPSTMVISAKLSGGEPTTYTYPNAVFTRLSKGVYRATIPHATAGNWTVTLTTTVPTIVVVGAVEVIDAR